jgi:signal transduction histidine kinase
LEKLGFELAEQLDAAEPVTFDADVLEQILGNLISNAEKYAKDGAFLGIETFSDGQMITITVRDRGPGVPKNNGRKSLRPSSGSTTKSPMAPGAQVLA